ncbi:hypothetical protein IWQ47_001140 [Aquimarina sp. EL_43]|nr:hypothetical protein [Aquimarina sp. EL_35]MBG6150622.1 hypothetical protein [Aquimarina sp. EL_32]MBG6168070.1 hypothetical protein [Aquimarina sp. EL_43]
MKGVKQSHASILNTILLHLKSISLTYHYYDPRTYSQ